MFEAVLSDETIMKYNKKGLLIEQPISEIQLQPNSVDLTLGNTWRKLKKNVKHPAIPSAMFNKNVGLIDTRIEPKYEEGRFEKHWYDDEEECYILQPGEFILMASREILNIPNGILSFVQGRSSIARLGIQTEQAGLIDAGFRGTITFEVENQTKYQIILYAGMRIAQVYFFKAQEAQNPYGSNRGSKYSGQIEATGSAIHLDRR